MERVGGGARSTPGASARRLDLGAAGGSTSKVGRVVAARCRRDHASYVADESTLPLGAGGLMSVRTLAVWCRDWPVVALDAPVGEPVAVVRANRVVATSASARVAGVSVGLRRREAQRRCPEVRVVERDEDREARVFERIAAALGDITPRLEAVVPGRCAFPTRGPSRYFGGDEALAGRVGALVGGLLAERDGCGVGIADGGFAATLAAGRSLQRAGSPPALASARWRPAGTRRAPWTGPRRWAAT